MTAEVGKLLFAAISIDDSLPKANKRKREEEEKAAEYEELLAYAKEFVQKDPRVGAAIFKQWLQEDVEKGLA